MGTLCERCPWGRRTRSVDSERVSWCISPSIKCASSGSRFWTMDNPSAQLQHMAMCVLDALYTKPPRVRGSDTVLCVNSGTANACTQRIVVRQGTSKLLCRAKHGILRQTLVQCAVQNWHEQRRSKTATSCLQVGNAGMRSRSTSWSVRPSTGSSQYPRGQSVSHGSQFLTWKSATVGFLSKPLPPHQRTKPVAETLPLRWGRRLLCSTTWSCGGAR